ncbi:MAG TPA: FAD-binding oxidoreductase [Candidatus Binataceae bacterium]|nr:FAD-binding oxidoreductase [Candidatus Binataceae bacterium]
MRSLLGAERVRAPRGGEALAAALIVEPRDADEVAEVVRVCEAERIALAPLGAARTLAEIRRAPVALGVSLARMNRIVTYEPEDMTVTVEAGIALGALNARLAAHGQRLPLDPPDPQAAAVGALLGAAHSGPLRLSEGTPRDLLIGVRFVGHSGRLVHGGGRVVKNVAGYDLMKVMTGSFGTLGIIHEATFKVRPLPEDYTTGLTAFKSTAAAFAAAAALNDALPLVHLEVLSPAPAARFGYAGAFLTLTGFAGNPSEIAYQRGRIAELASGAEFIEGARANENYELLRDLELAPTPGGAAAMVARLATPPAELARCVEACAAEFRAHAGSGVAEIFVGGDLSPAEARKALARWRAAAHAVRGNLRLLAAAPALRAHLDFFDEPPAGALGLMRRMKTVFDPAGIFNPGCFAGGI